MQASHQWSLAMNSNAANACVMRKRMHCHDCVHRPVKTPINSSREPCRSAFNLHDICNTPIIQHEPEQACLHQCNCCKSPSSHATTARRPSAMQLLLPVTHQQCNRRVPHKGHGHRQLALVAAGVSATGRVRQPRQAQPAGTLSAVWSECMSMIHSMVVFSDRTLGRPADNDQVCKCLPVITLCAPNTVSTT